MASQTRASFTGFDMFVLLTVPWISSPNLCQAVEGFVRSESIKKWKGKLVKHPKNPEVFFYHGLISLTHGAGL